MCNELENSKKLSTTKEETTSWFTVNRHCFLIPVMHISLSKSLRVSGARPPDAGLSASLLCWCVRPQWETAATICLISDETTANINKWGFCRARFDETMLGITGCHSIDVPMYHEEVTETEVWVVLSIQKSPGAEPKSWLSDKKSREVTKVEFTFLINKMHFHMEVILSLLPSSQLPPHYSLMDGLFTFQHKHRMRLNSTGRTVYCMCLAMHITLHVSVYVCVCVYEEEQVVHGAIDNRKEL